MPGFSPDGLAVFSVAGDRLRSSASTAAPGRPMTIPSLELRSPPTIRPPRWCGPAGPSYLSGPEAYKERYPADLAARRAVRPPSWAFLPLTVAGRTIGAWMAGVQEPGGLHPRRALGAHHGGPDAGAGPARAGAAESERELSLGLQRTMMPALGPEIPGMTVAARYIPTGGGLQVGGDWYDVIPLPVGPAPRWSSATSRAMTYAPPG